MDYEIEVAGLKRSLKLCPISQDINISAFIIIGDQELTVKSAEALLKIAPEYDYLLSAEAKGIPLIHEMARQHGDKEYMVARKGIKLYMDNPISVSVKSITTEKDQKLYLDGEQIARMKGKRVLIVDDVISTGRSLEALEELASLAGAQVVGKMAILAEGDAVGRDDIIYLQKLPLFDAKGSPLPF